MKSSRANGHVAPFAGLEGTMLGPSIFSGRITGGCAAQAAGYGGRPWATGTS